MDVRDGHAARWANVSGLSKVQHDMCCKGGSWRSARSVTVSDGLAPRTRSAVRLGYSSSRPACPESVPPSSVNFVVSDSRDRRRTGDGHLH